MLAFALILACDKTPDDSGPVAADNFGVVETEGEAHCDNLADGHCMMPFPSDVWMTDGRVALVQQAMPEGLGGAHIRADLFVGDGFGSASPVLFQLPGATAVGAPGVFEPAASMVDGALTVLIDTSTGERIPHWLEPDYLDVRQDPQVLILRPAVPLPEGTRVVVGIRGLVDAVGEEVAAPAGFAALRDAEASHRLGVHARRARYEEVVFPALAAAGFAREELQLAWDFTVGTDASATADLRAVRDAMLEAVGGSGPTYRIDAAVTETGDANIGLILDGVATVPSFLLAPDALGLRALRRGPDGAPLAEGTQEVPFRVQVPFSVLEGTAPAPVLQYGHGFLGSRGEANNEWLRSLAQRERFVILAADLQGMSSSNEEPWVRALLSDAGLVPLMSDEPLQGLSNLVALQRLATGSLVDEPHLRREDGSAMIDPGTLWYYGNSQGGTMGTIVMALSSDVERGVLGVPGCAYPFLLHRSVDFGEYVDVLGGIYDGPGDFSLFLALLGTGWDRLEPLRWARHLAADPLPDAPAHQVLLHVAREDAQVHTELSFLLGRATDAVQPRPAVRDVWGLTPGTFPVTAPSVLVEHDFGVAVDSTPLDPPVQETDTHEVLRRDARGQAQVMHFLRTGEVIDTCGGPCVPPT